MSGGRKAGMIIMTVVLAISALWWITSKYQEINSAEAAAFWKRLLYVPPLYGFIAPVVITARSAVNSNCSTGRYVGGLFASTAITYIGMGIGSGLFSMIVIAATSAPLVVVGAYAVFIIPIAISFISAKIFNSGLID